MLSESIIFSVLKNENKKQFLVIKYFICFLFYRTKICSKKQFPNRFWVTYFLPSQTQNKHTNEVLFIILYSKIRNKTLSFV